MEKTLTGLSLLITRPAQQSAPLMRKVTELGGKAWLFPTLEIIPHSPAQLKSILTPKSYWDKVIFTSANAVYPIMPFWPALTCHPQIFAIGSGTARALAEHQIDARLPVEDFSSEGLLSLPEFQSINQQRLVIFTGRAGRNFLAPQLRQRGALVRMVPVYERSCPRLVLDEAYQEWQQLGLPVIIISTSSESLRNLCSMTKTAASRSWLYQQQLLVISPRMRQMAHNLGFQQPAWLAANASDEAIIEALSVYVKSARHPSGSVL